MIGDLAAGPREGKAQRKSAKTEYSGMNGTSRDIWGEVEQHALDATGLRPFDKLRAGSGLTVEAAVAT